MGKIEDNLTFEDIINQTLKEIKIGTTVTGTVVDITKQNEIFVDIGYKADGIIPRNEYFSENGLEPSEEFKVGDKIKATILKLNDGQGNVLMSCKKLKINEIKKEFKQKVDNNEIFEEVVKQTNKNGLIVTYKNLIRIFIPISLSEISRDEDVNTYKGKVVKFKIIECDEKGKKIIGSIKELVEEEKKKRLEEFWNNIDVGKKYLGTVTSISDYGAFVDIGGVQGLLHISEMTWGRNQNPRDILTVGQEIEVRVKELDKENKRFKLTYEKKGPNPWNKVEEKYHIGDVVKVTPIEFKILQLLIKSPGRVFSAEEIYERVWNENAVNTDTVMVHVRNIREKSATTNRENTSIRNRVSGWKKRLTSTS